MVILLFFYIKFRHIERIGFLQGDAEHSNKGVFYSLAAVYGDRIIEGRNNLDGHSRFNLYSVADFLAFRCDSKKCHNNMSLFV